MRIIQLTDSHLLKSPENSLHGYLTDKNILDCLELTKSLSPELIVFTGDISEDGSLESYVRVKEYLDLTNIKYVVIPGNHDDIANMETVFKESLHLDKALKIGHWNLIFLNSVIPGEIYGTLAIETLNWLSQSLENETLPVAIFLHHHPIQLNSPLMDQYALKNPNDLWKALSNHGKKVKFIGCGHVHQEYYAKVGDIEFFATPSTSIQFKPYMKVVEFDNLPAGVRQFELLKNGKFTTKVYRVTKE